MAVIRLFVGIAPSRHRREKGLIVEALRGQRDLARIQPILYSTRIEFHGKYFKADGSPYRRNMDSIIISLFDAIEEASGVEDCWFDRFTSWGTYKAPRESVVITMTPI